MPKRAIVVADRARARFVTIERPSDLEFEGGPTLVEHEDLVNPEATLMGRDLFANLKSGRGRAPGGGAAHGFDDHRGRHEQEMVRRFSRRISEAALAFVEEHGVTDLLVVAEPHVLGLLRNGFDALTARGIRLEEIAENLSWRSLPHIQDVLARRGLLQSRQAPATAYRPRGQPPSSGSA